MGDGTKQVRVDNWGIFFLQRLQMFFSKTDYCDMTLQFEGNVQLKVHRLVMNACTEYFQFLEQTCALEDNVIIMPSDLQADVIVPIVNFMYTGMLEFHLSIFDRLYKTAQLMNITILTKLLDAQKQPTGSSIKSGMKKKHTESLYTPPAKKSVSRPSYHSDLPAPLPGRKLPIWKRKSIPTPSPSHHISSQVSYPESKWSPVDPLSVPDNTPKPTRFEWPEDDLPPLNPMDTSFEEISYTSKPLLTQEEEQRGSANFDDLKHIPNANRTPVSTKKQTSPCLDMEEMKNYVKEQKIRSGLSQEDEEAVDDLDVVVEAGQKRKAAEVKVKGIVKKVRFEEQENKGTTISIATDGKSGAELNHEKIVAEILKKYPQLVKKNKNIRLKIMAKNKTALETAKPENKRVKPLEIQKVDSSKPARGSETKAPWVCDRCSTEEEPMEFVLYYLYRKHMTDVHNEKFDSKLCKYCGHRCNKQNLLMYHLYTKHGMKPQPGYNFPKCDQCPFIALSTNILNKHKSRHNKNEIQCTDCKLAFTSQTTLTSHIQITGHTGKSSKNNYDCQYCTKRFQSGINLFSHVRLQHKNEAIRDGIVSVDEMDDIEEYDDEENEKDEYILPEIISDSETQPTKKVNILSNVKVQDRQEQQQLALEPSSEAEALNNVATGIATSLGLVDIVVLNDSQQIFLQSEQQNFNQNDQPEFILPELTTRDSFGRNENEVMTTDGVLTQSMLSSSDIGSTDELVMVLTDHDYGDNQEEINNDNSNIVVLYSHPVDGQQDQFITSQGNIMVNSQGLLEIRNGATITSTANQSVINSQDTHIESIEMIQREIESQQELKQEANLYEEERKPEARSKEQNIEEEQKKEDNRNDSLIESLSQGEQLEFTTPLVPLNEVQNTENAITATEENHEKNEGVSSEDNNDEKPEEKENIEDTLNDISLETQKPSEEENPEVTFVAESPKSIQTNVEEKDEEVEEEKVEETCSTENQETAKEVTEIQVQEKSSSSVEENKEEDQEEKEEENQEEKEEENQEEKEEENQEEKEVENQEEKEEENQEEKEDAEKIPQPSKDLEKDESKTNGDDSVENEEEAVTEENVEDDKTQESCTTEQELSQSDTSTSQYNDENSEFSQDSHNKEKVTTKISILDDWEDTDSQQSDQREKTKEADETVHKLMVDWDDEEEDENRKEADG